MKKYIEDNYQKFLSFIEDSTEITIVGHLNPDGDCLGALIGMKNFISQRYKDKRVSIVVPTSYPSTLSFLDPDKKIFINELQPLESKIAVENCDLLICMDLSSPSRVEKLEESIRSSKGRKVLIDHHLDPESFADLTFSFTKISSTCEITYWLLKKCNQTELLSTNILEPLCVGLITDTNNFSNSIFPSTFLMASQLIEGKVDIEKIQEKVLNSYSQERMRLMGEMLLNRMKIWDDLHSSLMILDLETQKKYNFERGDSEGFVNLPLKISDIAISGLFTQERDYVRVSLRSKGDISVNELSKAYFNGGGHKNAAGGRLYMNIAEIPDYFEQSVRRFVKENGISFED